MFRSRVLVVFLALGTGAIAAQQVPTVEFFGGYSFGIANAGDLNRHANFKGWNISTSYSLNSWLGFVAEGSGLYGSKQLLPPSMISSPCLPGVSNCAPSIQLGATHLSQHIYTYSFGPRFSFRNNSRFTPFAHALLGGGRTGDFVSRIDSVGLGLFGGDSSGSTVLTTGGGMDISLTPRLAWRTQGDFFRSRFFHGVQPGSRISAGVVLRFRTNDARK